MDGVPPISSLGTDPTTEDSPSPSASGLFLAVCSLALGICGEMDQTTRHEMITLLLLLAACAAFFTTE
jgi:hypothetical protein